MDDSSIVALDGAELTAGTLIMAIGAQNGEVFQATQVRIMPAPKE